MLNVCVGGGIHGLAFCNKVQRSCFCAETSRWNDTRSLYWRFGKGNSTFRNYQVLLIGVCYCQFCKANLIDIFFLLFSGSCFGLSEIQLIVNRRELYSTGWVWLNFFVLLGSYCVSNSFFNFKFILNRDGVSEGQFNQVLLYEMDAIRKVCGIWGILLKRGQDACFITVTIIYEDTLIETLEQNSFCVSYGNAWCCNWRFIPLFLIVSFIYLVSGL